MGISGLHKKGPPIRIQFVGVGFLIAQIHFLRGAQPYAAFEKAIEALLADAEKPADAGSE